MPGAHACFAFAGRFDARQTGRGSDSLGHLRRVTTRRLLNRRRHLRRIRQATTVGPDPTGNGQNRSRHQRQHGHRPSPNSLYCSTIQVQHQQTSCRCKIQCDTDYMFIGIGLSRLKPKKMLPSNPSPNPLLDADPVEVDYPARLWSGQTGTSRHLFDQEPDACHALSRPCY